MIKVGEFVRTKTNGIKRIDTIFENKTVNRYGYEIGSEWDGKLYSTIKTTDIVKHSKNIIDLIEVGDYVNGHRVIGVTLDPAPSGKCVDIDCDKPSYESYLFEEQIYSIVTREQFTQAEYKIEKGK